ncbi:helix-turn-helix domain-containing protein [Vibrio rhizosphaerae]|uniref:helix-turn-helix domain-containing protein n=1 Tax=Vibrio rhizosphaerae TaxID=398736 RepID=UPI000A0444F8|nr:LysR family transcriptional regulator [Vibrio rhizosphaerae]
MNRIEKHFHFCKAADHLGVSRSALSHVIKGLEAYLGSQIFMSDFCQLLIAKFAL